MTIIKLSVRQQVNRINKWLEKATPFDYASGLTWYDEARELCVKLSQEFPVNIEQVSQVISILSPQKKWNANKQETIALFNEVFNNIPYELNYFATKKQIEECKAIIKGSFALPTNRLKTWSFADNIANKDSLAVTIDRHAIKIAFNQTSSKELNITTKRYHNAKKAYTIVAEQHGLKPYQIQAITWCVYKRVVER